MRTKRLVIVCFLGMCSILLSCTGPDNRAPSPSPAETGLDNIHPQTLAQHTKELASDAFGGRLPGSPGEELTIHYLIDQFRKIGLQPGNPNGTYLQPVPLAGITADPSMQLVLRSRKRKIALHYGTEFMAWTKRVVDNVSVENSDLVFVGYGVVAPEFHWDDYKGVDVKNKTLIMLVNDPPIPDQADPSKLDTEIFGGKAMTYYGRWTYKYEITAEKGAAACFIIHNTEPAGYPWEVVSGSWSGEQFDLVTPDKNLSRAAVEGWLTGESAERVFQMAGLDLEELKNRAADPDFKPVPLDLQASVSVRNTLRQVDSNNVIARLEGSDPKLKDESIVYIAHWDHLGRDPTLEGDQIYNGALDNATGTSGLLELAAAFKQLQTPPRRSLLFLSVTAEEQGLLGSRYYAENPLDPLVKTAAAINMDGLNIWGKTRDITIIGLGNSNLDDLLEAAAQAQGRQVVADPEPEKGYFYRSDHFNFAKQGVPALYTDSGVDYVGRPQGWGMEMREKYVRENYHKPSDEFSADWDWSGAVEDLQLLFQVGYQVANQEPYPEWKAGTEFKAKREQMMKEASSQQP